MARLPQPGGDNGSWGEILNDFLLQSHTSDGALKDNIVSAATIQNGTISEAQLDALTQSKLNTTGSGGVADGTITTAKLHDDAVTDAKVAPGAAIAQSKIASLTTDLGNKLDTQTFLRARRSGGNLASDVLMADPLLWGGSTSGFTQVVSTEQAYTGTTSLKLTKTIASGSPGSSFFRSPSNGGIDSLVYCSPGDTFSASCAFRAHASNTGDNTIRLRATYIDSSGVNAALFNYGSFVTASSLAWHVSRAWFTVPSGYDQIRVGFVVGLSSHQNDVFYIDHPKVYDISDQSTILVSPGITATELNLILSARSAVIIEFAPGTYTGLDGVITLKSNQRIVGNGAVLKSDTLQFVAKGHGDGNLPHVGGTLLTSNQQKGSFTIQLNPGMGAGFTENDVVYLRAENTVSINVGGIGGSEFAVPTELHQVHAVVGDVLHLTKGLTHEYTVANAVRIAKISTVSGIAIEGITFTNVTTAAFPRPQVIDIAQSVGLDIDVKSINGGQVNIQDDIGSRVRVHVETNRPWDTTLGTPLGYGVYVTGHGHSTQVDVTGWGTRHLFTTYGGGSGGVASVGRTGPYDVVVRGSGLTGSQYEAHSIFDTHPHAYNITFVGCVAMAGDNASSGSRRDNTAFADRAHNTTLLNCRGVGFYAGVRSDRMSRDLKVIGGHFESWSSEAAAVLVGGQGTKIMNAYLAGPIGVRLVDNNAELAEYPQRTLINGCTIESTVASIVDSSNGGSGDTTAIEKDTTFILAGGIRHDGFVGQRDNGAGSPEGAVTAPRGAMYHRTDGGAGTTLYIKESGVGNTGWVAK